jgi:hypothetical protein
MKVKRKALGTQRGTTSYKNLMVVPSILTRKRRAFNLAQQPATG